MEVVRYPEHLVFGLDIGTRSIVGTVGYKENEKQFKVVAQVTMLHETRAMIDGQIHDISKVAETIGLVKRQLEQKVGRRLNDVCIAAAGRVLKTLSVDGEYEFPSETQVTDEHIHSLDLLAVERAYDQLREESKTQDIHYYCVGYSVIRYYLNGYAISNLEGHKALKIKTELLATFLPEEVIDGLYAAVERAGLYVANLTLEPIAAINVAIPEQFRLLNIGLVDVGAGTSDISITKDGSIVAYGMMPYAGDEITENLARKYLVDFQTSEKIKLSCLNKKSITYKDIMGISHKIAVKEVLEAAEDTVNMITKSIAKKVVELNGGKSVSAVFLVGGGGKLPGFTDHLAKFLELSPDRVALRGMEVLKDIIFLEDGVKKDSLMVTPIGICLNFYEHNNNFIFVQVNGERVKLYDNNKLTIVDAAVQIGFPNECLFPRRGKPINFTLNGEKRLVRGELGEAAIVKLNGNVVGINYALEQNDRIEIVSSSIGPDAEYEVRNLPEYNGVIEFVFNEKRIYCPKFVRANQELVSGFYSIQEEDEIQILNYYTLEQVLEFMDLEYNENILVNHVAASLDVKIYDNFSIQYQLHTEPISISAINSTMKKEEEKKRIVKSTPKPIEITVFVNQTPVVLKEKPSYILVDVLDVYPFDLSVAKGSSLILKVNNTDAEFTSSIQEGDKILIDWKG